MLSSDKSSGVGIRQDQLAPSSLQMDTISESYTYDLRVIQQPRRARMCGFGEKDRRACTPPPILQLFIYDRATGNEIDVSQIDSSFFTSTCNLYSVDMRSEVNLIKQRNSHGQSAANTSAAASNAVAAELIQRSFQYSMSIPDSDGTRDAAAIQSEFVHGQNNGLSPQQIMGERMVAAATMIQGDLQGNGGGGGFGGGSAPMVPQIAPISMTFPPSVAYMDTVRNLIGPSVTTGIKLLGLDGKPGIFFTFPDLSIRKDGEYRFQFLFFDLKGQGDELIKDKTKIRARTFSDPFRVYSAKQFPGMIESTPLSKHFARQGLKIRVRKDTSNKNRSNTEDDNDRLD